MNATPGEIQQERILVWARRVIGVEGCIERLPSIGELLECSAFLGQGIGSHTQEFERIDVFLIFDLVQCSHPLLPCLRAGANGVLNGWPVLFLLGF